MSADAVFLRDACASAAESASAGGGPFAALIVCDGAVIARGANQVVATHDPTAHAEMVVLRAAGAELGTHDLSGCVLFASCRPCPMCLTAAWWARVDRIVYAASTEEAAAAGFDDDRFWAAITGSGPSPRPVEHLALPERLDPFRAWAANPDRQTY